MNRLNCPNSQRPTRSGWRKNHAFVDGNKRIAFMAMMVFLRETASHFQPDPAHATAMILAARRRRGERGKPDPLDPGQLAGGSPLVARKRSW